jgi:hypothetical protein
VFSQVDARVWGDVCSCVGRRVFVCGETCMCFEVKMCVFFVENVCVFCGKRLCFWPEGIKKACDRHGYRLNLNMCKCELVTFSSLFPWFDFL